MEAMLTADKNYVFRQFIKMGVFVGGAGIEPVPEEQGKKDVAQLEMAKLGNCSGAKQEARRTFLNARTFQGGVRRSQDFRAVHRCSRADGTMSRPIPAERFNYPSSEPWPDGWGAVSALE
jgi:hypothetical protein